MVIYRAVEFFTDLQDKNHAYKVGDVYPRKGLVVDNKRIYELLGSDNKQHRPVITAEVVDDEIPFTEKKYTTKQLESMTIAQIEELAKERGYVLNSTLKADIIDEFLSQQ